MSHNCHKNRCHSECDDESDSQCTNKSCNKYKGSKITRNVCCDSDSDSDADAHCNPTCCYPRLPRKNTHYVSFNSGYIKPQDDNPFVIGSGTSNSTSDIAINLYGSLVYDSLSFIVPQNLSIIKFEVGMNYFPSLPAYNLNIYPTITFTVYVQSAVSNNGTTYLTNTNYNITPVNSVIRLPLSVIPKTNYKASGVTNLPIPYNLNAGDRITIVVNVSGISLQSREQDKLTLESTVVLTER
jgi:hypothetical protein